MKWEYKSIIRVGNDADKVVQELGLLGWEMFAVSDELAYFKRPIEEQDHRLYVRNCANSNLSNQE